MIPLAKRLCPKTLDEIIGQPHLLNEGCALRKLIENDNLRSLILYGPAGTGKTTIAEVISNKTKSLFIRLNATSAKVSDIRKYANTAKIHKNNTIIFIDEIHRFTKTQQDVLLPYIENGDIIFIGATTENPFHAIQSPLISRSTIFKLEPLTKKDILKLIIRVLDIYKPRNIGMSAEAVEHVVNMCCGDGRKAINILELAFELLPDQDQFGIEEMKMACPSKYLIMSKDQHFDLASAFQGSIQASDPDAAIYWLAKWLESGEDTRYIARRILVSAAEDAYSTPECTLIAHAAYRAACDIGRPECDINLAQATIMIAKAPRNKTAANAIWNAIKDVKEEEDIIIPKEMRDSHYPGATTLGHGKYKEGADQGAYVGITKKYIKSNNENTIH